MTLRKTVLQKKRRLQQTAQGSEKLDGRVVIPHSGLTYRLSQVFSSRFVAAKKKRANRVFSVQARVISEKSAAFSLCFTEA